MLPKVANDSNKAERWVEAERVVKQRKKKWGQDGLKNNSGEQKNEYKLRLALEH
jgi:hypothetical protein